MFDINEKLGGMDLEKEKFEFCVRKYKELKLIKSLEIEQPHWGYFWEQHQKQIEKAGVGNGWEDMKESEVWGVGNE